MTEIYSFNQDDSAVKVKGILYSLAKSWDGDADDLVGDCLLYLFRFTNVFIDGDGIGAIGIMARRSFAETLMKEKRNKIIPLSPSQDYAVSIVVNSLRELAPQNRLEKKILDLCQDAEPYWVWALSNYTRVTTPSVTSLAKFLGYKRRRVESSIKNLRSRSDVGSCERSIVSASKNATTKELVRSDSRGQSKRLARGVATLGRNRKEKGENRKVNDAAKQVKTNNETIQKNDRRNRAMGYSVEKAKSIMRAGQEFFGGDLSPFKFRSKQEDQWEDQAHGWIKEAQEKDWYDLDFANAAPDVLIELAADAGCLNGSAIEDDLDSLLDSAEEDLLSDAEEDPKPSTETEAEDLYEAIEDLADDLDDDPEIEDDPIEKTKTEDLADRAGVVTSEQSSVVTLANADAMVHTMMNVLKSGKVLVVAAMDVADLASFLSPSKTMADHSKPDPKPVKKKSTAKKVAKPVKESLTKAQQKKVDTIMDSEIPKIKDRVTRGDLKDPAARDEYMKKYMPNEDPSDWGTRKKGTAIIRSLSDRTRAAAVKKVKK